MHTTHTAHVTRGWWAPARVSTRLGTGRDGGHPFNSSHQHKAPLLLHPAHTHVLGGTHTPPRRDMHPTAAPAVHPHSCELQFTVTPAPSARSRTHTRTSTHTCYALFSHPRQGHADTGVDVGPHNRCPTPHQCHPPARAPGSSRSCVPGTRWGPQAARGLSLLQAVSLPWHILACHHPAVTLPQALPGSGFGTRFAGTVQPEWPVPPRRAWVSFPKVKEPSEGGEWDPHTLCQRLPLPASVSPARAAEQDGSPHWALHGHRDPPRAGQSFGTGIPHTPGAEGHRDAPHTGCLQPRGSSTLGAFLGTGIPQRLSTLRAQNSPVPATYGHRDASRWALYGHRDLSCRLLYGHRGPLTLGTGVPPLWEL